MLPAAYPHLLNNRFRNHDMTDCFYRKRFPGWRKAAAVGRAQSLDCSPILPPLVAANNNAEQKRNFTHSFQCCRGRILYNGDIRADREGARLPAPLVNRPTFIFWGDFMPGGKRNCGVKARFIGNPSEWGRCHSDSITCAISVGFISYGNKGAASLNAQPHHPLIPLCHLLQYDSGCSCFFFSHTLQLLNWTLYYNSSSTHPSIGVCILELLESFPAALG